MTNITGTNSDSMSVLQLDNSGVAHLANLFQTPKLRVVCYNLMCLYMNAHSLMPVYTRYDELVCC